MKHLLLAFPLLFSVACNDIIVLENGAACEIEAEDEVCESGKCLEEYKDGTEVAGGMCTTDCTWNADTSDDCTDVEVCLRYNPTDEFNCYQDCAEQEECRGEDGWTCTCLDFFCTERACIPPFEEDATRELPTESVPRALLYDTALEALY